jgi:hypothetical protein
MTLFSRPGSEILSRGYSKIKESLSNVCFKLLLFSIFFELLTAKEDSAKQTPVTDPSVISGSDKGPPDVYTGPPKQANKQVQPGEEPSSHQPVSGSSNPNEESDKTNAHTLVPPGKELERRQNKDPDSMDLGED